jgi:hypothetical protein
VSDASRLDRLYRHYAEHDAVTLGSPAYGAICAGLAGDHARGHLALDAPDGFRIPNILLSAVHYLLLAGTPDPLARYYPTVAGDAAQPVDAALYPTFASFIDRHEERLRQLIAGHTTQTNEVGRAGLLLPALGHVADGGPVSLLEVGTSAGLNQLLDRYHYRIGEVELGSQRSRVRVTCELRGELVPPIPGTIPRIAWRAGLDRTPIDLTDRHAADWLRAQVWPEHRDRMANLDAAMAVARKVRPRIVRGDAVDDLAPLSREAPGDARLAIVSTSMLVYLDKGRRRAFSDELRRIASTRPGATWLVACEPESVLQSMGVGLEPSGMDAPDLNALAVVRFGPDGVVGRLLAMCHPHGRWMRWLDPESGRPA